MAGAWRTIRVFISSSFKDMQAERDYLVKHVFPELRKRCRERAVEFVEVDLRWGVTEEQANRGEVLPICLREIELCRPYFIGLLGERYGWVPDHIPSELMKEQPWLAEHREHSVTDLEIVHGVLKNTEKDQRAYFYFRDPAYVDRLPDDHRGDFLAETPEAQARLAKLKDLIRASGLPLKENYPDPEAVGQWILEDLWAAIDQEYPAGEVPDPLAREAAEHEAFALSRAKVYIGRAEYFAQLDEHVEGDGPPLVILGESGVGKSALLANWVLDYRKKHPDDFFFCHFFGSTPRSTNYVAMLNRLIAEIKSRTGDPEEVPNQPDKLREALPRWLAKASGWAGREDRRVVLVLDALNQLEDWDAALDLAWLPNYLPPHVRVILSTLPGRPLTALEKRGWPIFTVGGLKPEEIRQVISAYLLQYRKTLEEPLLAHLVAAPQCANPLYLKAILEELRVFGVFEELQNRVCHYLAAPDPPALYSLILTRLEEDYEKPRPGLVGDALSLIWASRRGLYESELLELLGTDGQPLPRAFWSPLFLAMEDSLVSHSGLLNFFHDYLRQAMQRRYLTNSELEPDPQAEVSIHLRLADYFDKRDLNDRKIEELPWQLYAAASWQKLFDVLKDLNFFVSAWDHQNGLNQFQVRKYWAAIEQHSSLCMHDAYATALKNPGAIRDAQALYDIARLFSESGHTHEALPLMNHLTERFHTEKPDKLYTDTLFTLATFLLDTGETDRASDMNIKLRRAYQFFDDQAGIAACTINQAEIWRLRGDLPRTRQLFQYGADLLRQLNRRVELARCLTKLAPILTMLNELEQAEGILDEAEQIAREVNDDATRALCLNVRGVIALRRQRLEEALNWHEQEEDLCRLQGDWVGIQRALGSQAIIQYLLRRLPEATRLYEEAIEVCIRINNKEGLACSLGGLARVLRELGKLDKAMKLQEQEAELCLEIGATMQYAGCLAEQAKTLKVQGKNEESQELMQRARKILKDLGLSPDEN
jgi:tetratricopeptide (TPR) repeat protein